MRLLGLAIVALLLQPQATVVTGRVTDSESNAPIAGARVLLARTDGPLPQSPVTTTDDRGGFSVQGVPAGGFRVFAERDGYLRGEHRTSITVAGGQPLNDVAVILVPTGVISGRVYTEHGDPASKIFVRALTASQVLSTFPKWVAEARTNDLGEFRLFNLPAGTYIVNAQRYPGPHIDGSNYRVPTPPCPDCRGEGAGMMSLAGLLKTGAFIAPGALTKQTYPPVYFPDATELAAGQPIEVRPGKEVYGIDLRLIVR